VLLKSKPPPNQNKKVIIEYDNTASAAAARTAMHGRKFGGHVVIGTFLQEDAYRAGQF
jgi:splicing factor U2AF subunit